MKNKVLIKKLKSYFSNISPDCYAVSIYLFFLPFTIVSTPLGSLLKVITYPVIAVLFYKLFFGKAKPLRFSKTLLAHAIYVIYTVGCLFLLINESNTTIIIDMILSLFMILLVSMRVYNLEERKFLETTWVLMGIFCIYLGLFKSHEVNEYESRIVIEIFGQQEDANQFCAYFIVPVLICMKRITEKSKLSLAYVALVLLMLYVVLNTGSRGGLIGVLAGVIMFLMLGKGSLGSKILLLFLTALAFLVVVYLIFPLLPEDVQARFSIEQVVEDKGSGRFLIWNYLINYATETPGRILHGSGLYSTFDILANSNLGLPARVAHNQFLQVFVEQGILGLILFLLNLAVPFFDNIKKKPEYACSLLAIMVMALSLTWYVFKPYINILIMCASTFEKEKRK